MQKVCDRTSLHNLIEFNKGNNWLRNNIIRIAGKPPEFIPGENLPLPSWSPSFYKSRLSRILYDMSLVDYWRRRSFDLQSELKFKDENKLKFILWNRELLTSVDDNRRTSVSLICLASTLSADNSRISSNKKLKLKFLLCSEFRARNSINSFYWSLETVVGYHVERSSFQANTIVWTLVGDWTGEWVSERVLQSITLKPVQMKNEPGDGIVINFICTSEFLTHGLMQSCSLMLTEKLHFLLTPHATAF